MDSSIINDDVLFKHLDINNDTSFGEFIRRISAYAYEEIDLDPTFRIEQKLRSLLECELFLSITKKRHRDHLLHACCIAILGEKLLNEKITYYGKEFTLLDLVREIYKNNRDIAELFKFHELEINNKNLLKIWIIGALFHDIGFIYEAFRETTKNIEFFSSIKEFKKLFLDVENAITTFESSLAKGDNNISNMRKFDHATSGKCIISNLLGENNLICSMAANLTDCHTSSDILSFSEDPLSFLLVLLDEIQDWQLPAAGKKLRDEALCEKIGVFSPFIDSNVRPELNSISISLNTVKMDDGNEKLNLSFMLDYLDSIKIQDETNFSFTIVLYLKYKNFQRLRIGDEVALKKALNKCCNLNKSFNFNINISLKSSGGLAYKWHRQCDILLFGSLRSKNKIITNWLYNVIKYKEHMGLVTFEIDNKKGLQRIFSGDFLPIFEEEHRNYLNSLFLSIDDHAAEYAYNTGASDSEMEITLTHDRTLRNLRKEHPINGFYALIDDKIKNVKIISVREDNKEIKDKVEFYKIQKKDITGAFCFEESFAFYIPFETPLYYSPTKKLHYEIKFTLPRKKERYFDSVFNIYRNPTPNGKIVVKWKKELFDSMFQRGVKFLGNDQDIEDLVSSAERNENLTKCKAYTGYAQKNLDVNNDYYEFILQNINIGSLESAGFFWLGLEADVDEILRD